jgi:hypothetical protein
LVSLEESFGINGSLTMCSYCRTGISRSDWFGSHNFVSGAPNNEKDDQERVLRLDRKAQKHSEVNDARGPGHYSESQAVDETGERNGQ